MEQKTFWIGDKVRILRNNHGELWALEDDYTGYIDEKNNGLYKIYYADQTNTYFTHHRWWVRADNLEMIRPGFWHRVWLFFGGITN